MGTRVCDYPSHDDGCTACGQHVWETSTHAHINRPDPGVVDVLCETCLDTTALAARLVFQAFHEAEGAGLRVGSWLEALEGRCVVVAVSGQLPL